MFTFTRLIVSAALVGVTLAGNDCPPPPEMPACGPQELFCANPPVPDNNCDMGGFCIPRMAGICPNSCPVTCAPGDLQCPGPMDPNGCLAPPMCIPAAPADAPCPATCTVFCSPNDLTCQGGTDPNGCMMPAMCLPNPPPAPGMCPSFCPTMCAPTDQQCPGPVDPMGCASPSSCMPMTDGQCPVFCPLQYQPSTQKLCDYDMGPDGCRMPPYTMPINGNCPALCAADRMCTAFSKDAIYCPFNDPQTGCEMQGMCMEPAMDKNNKPCPVMCPMICGPEMQMCPGLIDDNGCAMPALCLAPMDTCPMPAA